MGEFFKGRRWKAACGTFVSANMIAALYLLQIAFGGGRRFIPDKEERLREEAAIRFLKDLELTTIGLLVLLSAYLLLVKSRPKNLQQNA